MTFENGLGWRVRETSRAVRFNRYGARARETHWHRALENRLPWSTPFADPIELPDGRTLLTLRDAGAYINALSAAEQRKQHWQTAVETLLLVAERGGDPMLPHIAMLRALNHGKPEPPTGPQRKAAKKYTIIR